VLLQGGARCWVRLWEWGFRGPVLTSDRLRPWQTSIYSRLWTVFFFNVFDQAFRRQTVSVSLSSYSDRAVARREPHMVGVLEPHNPPGYRGGALFVLKARAL
jgi:hypothetical protein